MPDVEALLSRVTLRVDDAIPADFDRMHAIVTVTMKSGARHSRKVDKLSGWVGHPLTREQRMRKFHSCSRRVLEGGAAERLAGLVERLEDQPDVTAIMDIARGDAGV
jgi:2-methylcitrate dehydratase PrpD